MSIEKPNIIYRVPTAEELAASRPDGNAINFRDPAQLAEFNSARAELGAPAMAAPSEISPTDSDSAPTQSKPEQPVPEDFIEPDFERQTSAAELAELRQQIASEAGHAAVEG